MLKNSEAGEEEDRKEELTKLQQHLILLGYSSKGKKGTLAVKEFLNFFYGSGQGDQNDGIAGLKSDFIIRN